MKASEIAGNAITLIALTMLYMVYLPLCIVAYVIKAVFALTVFTLCACLVLVYKGVAAITRTR